MWGLLADADRRRVFAALALGEGTVSGVAAAGGVPVPKVMKALARLESAGVVRASGNHWELRTDVIEERARTEAGAGAASSPTYEEDGLGQQEASVLRAFLRDGRLVSIPATRSKRLVVLDHLARVFDHRDPLPRARGQRPATRVSPRPRSPAPVSGRRGIPHPRGGHLLAHRGDRHPLRATAEGRASKGSTGRQQAR